MVEAGACEPLLERAEPEAGGVSGTLSSAFAAVTDEAEEALGGEL